MARAKNTGRADARRRYREARRAAAAESSAEPTVTTSGEPATSTGRPRFQLPDVRADIRALPSMFRAKPLLWLPFGLLLGAFVVALAVEYGWLPGGIARDTGAFFVQMILPPPPLIVPFIGGFLAPRASWLVGLLVGVFYSFLLTVLWVAGATSTEGLTGAQLSESLLPLWVMSVLFATVSGGFAAWYRNFLRTSQERARANRLAREKEQAQKAKEQARKDREAQRAGATAGTTGGKATG